MWNLNAVIWLIGILCVISPAVPAGSEPTVRVAILKGLDHVSIEGESILIRDVWTYNAIVEPPEFAGFRLEPAAGHILIDGKDSETNWLNVIPKKTMMKLNGKPFRGKVEIAIDEDNLLVVVNELSIEDYVKGVINHEISSAWNIEAVKSQAIVARTYAIYQKRQRVNRFYDLESSVLDQVYGGAQNEDFRARYAVDETQGMVLFYDGEIVKPYYFSTCGGATEDAANVWGESKPYLSSVKCNFCKDSPAYKWTKSLSLNTIKNKLSAEGYKIGEIAKIIILGRTRSGRVLKLSIADSRGSVKLNGVDFRRIMGYNVIKSTSFEVKVNGGEAIFSGRGSGHGVGLCQWGAKGMADSGYNFKEILEYYYPGTKIERWYK